MKTSENSDKLEEHADEAGRDDLQDGGQQSIIGTIVSIVVILAVVMLFVVCVFGYYNYLHDEGRQQACVEEFGPGSDWVGNDFENGAVCETPAGETKIVEDASTMPVSPATYGEYLGDLVKSISEEAP